MKNLLSQQKKLEKAHDKWFSEIGNMEELLVDIVEFDFKIENVAGDGHCILHSDEARVAPLKFCLEVIKKKGILSYDDFRKYTI